MDRVQAGVGVGALLNHIYSIQSKKILISCISLSFLWTCNDKEALCAKDSDFPINVCK